MLKKIVLGLVVVASFTGCMKGDNSNNTTCNYDPCTYKKATASETQAVKDYLDANGISATQHCSGMFYAIDDAGTGKPVTACGAIIATYSGKLTDGTVFDSGTFQDFMPLGNLVLGWVNAIPLIKEGGKIRLYIPPSLGYGDKDVTDKQTGAVVIPANSIIIFDVTLDRVY